MSYYVQTYITAVCDAPGCRRQITTIDEEAGAGHGIDTKEKEKLGWEFHSYQSPDPLRLPFPLMTQAYEPFCLCPKCKNIDFQDNPTSKKHECRFVRDGKLLVCFFCGRVVPKGK